MLQRLMTNICSDKLEESKFFYQKLFDLIIAFDSDWFVQLQSADSGLELGIIDKNNDLVPMSYRAQANGFYLTLVVENADVVFAKAKELGIKILQEPEDTSYGQRRLLLKDPNEVLIDVSSPIPDFQF